MWCLPNFFRTNTWDKTEKGIVQKGEISIENGTRGRREQQAGLPSQL